MNCELIENIQGFITQKDKGYFILGDKLPNKDLPIFNDVLPDDWIIHTLNLSTLNHGNYTDDLVDLLVRFWILDDYPEVTNSSRPINDGCTLSKVLQIISEHLVGDEKVVILIDNLQEVNINTQPIGSNPLYLPAYLPKGIYFLLITESNQKDIGLFTYAPKEGMSFRDLKA